MGYVGFLIFFYIAIFAIYLAIWYHVAKKFEQVAFDKGYGVEIHSFAMVFWLGIVGCLYVVALTNRNLQKAIVSMNETDELKQIK